MLTYRYHGHHVGDVDRAYYRSKDEEREWAESRDPIQLLVDRGLVPAAELERIDAEVAAEVEAGVAFALDAPYPPESEVVEHVYA